MAIHTPQKFVLYLHNNPHHNWDLIDIAHILQSSHYPMFVCILHHVKYHTKHLMIHRQNVFQSKQNTQ